MNKGVTLFKLCCFAVIKVFKLIILATNIKLTVICNRNTKICSWAKL